MTATDWIDNLERKAKAATPGPWVADHSEEDNSAVKQEGRAWWDGLAFCGRPADAKFIAAVNPATILRLIEELRKATRAAQTLGKVIEDQCRDALNATGLHHLIDENGDGDWGAVWDNLAEIAAERDQWREMHQAQVHLAHVSDMKVAAVEALADETERAGDPLLRLDRLRAALSTAPHRHHQGDTVNSLNRLRYNLRQTQKIAGKAHENAEHTMFPGDQIRQDIAFMRQLLDRAERHLDDLTGRKGESR